MKLTNLFRQKSYYFVGLLQQVVGGVIGWLTIGIFIFSGITAWDSKTMSDIRVLFPWLTLSLFASVITICCLLLMWVMHKYIQPSIMNYWNKMFYEQDNPMTKQLNRMEGKIDKLLKEDSKKS